MNDDSRLDYSDAYPDGESNHDANAIVCPVCGYYCLGKGGFGCIDKPNMIKIQGERIRSNDDA
jgi:hypothetical protein